MAGDVTDEAQMTAAFAAAEAKGEVRATIHCAGGSKAIRVLDKDGRPGSLEDYSAVIKLNLIGTYGQDDPTFEGSFQCETGKTPSAQTCHGAIRCNDPAWRTNPYLIANSAVPSDVAARYCPGKADVGDCFGPIVCVLPHNQASDGRILPRLE